MRSEEFTFDSELQAHGRGGCFCLVPAAITAALGTRAQLRVRGTLNGCAFNSSMAPMGSGQHALLVHKATRETLGLLPGDVVHIAFARDTTERVVDIPHDLAAALAGTPAAEATFAALAYTHRKEYAAWVAEAKRPETRARRVAKAVEILLAGQKIS